MRNAKYEVVEVGRTIIHRFASHLVGYRANFTKCYIISMLHNNLVHYWVNILM